MDDRAPAFALSLLIVALVWLPLRDTFARWLLRRREPARAERFRKIMDVALIPPERDQSGRWNALLSDMFNPLGRAPGSEVSAPVLREDGLALVLPRIGEIHALELQYADGRRRLFSARDLDLATELTAMLEQALESRAAYEKGVSEYTIAGYIKDIYRKLGISSRAEASWHAARLGLGTPDQT